MTDAAQPIWDELHALTPHSLSALFEDDARLDALTGRIDWDLGEDRTGILFDWSKTHLDDTMLNVFERLAAAMDFDGKRSAMLTGAAINNTEGRAAEHTAQRGVGSDAAMEEAAALHARMRMLVDAIHDGAMGPVKHLIHVGIGGSALGPALAVDALTRDLAKVDVHVVSNIDGVAMEQAIAACDP
ncbi:MAG: glucose-6-phosphate isomerase, partial [Pontixanthobacter sp.]